MFIVRAIYFKKWINNTHSSRMIKGGITIEVYKRVAAAAAALERVVSFFLNAKAKTQKNLK